MNIEITEREKKLTIDCLTLVLEIGKLAVAAANDLSEEIKFGQELTESLNILQTIQDLISKLEALE